LFNNKLNRSKFYWRVNHDIRANTLRVIGEDGKQIGIMSLSEALAHANETNLDLIEVVPTANPPVAKIMDFGKFRYQEEKKQKQEAKKQKGGDLKEIRFSPFIAQGDYNTRMERVKEFLTEGDKVKLVVVFKGRQLGSKQFGYELLGKINGELKDRIAVDMEPKFLGRHLVMIISPVKKVKKEIKEVVANKAEEKTEDIEDKKEKQK